MDAIIDRLIQDAARKGAFDDLPGQGKPLPEQSAPGDAVLNRLMNESRAKPLAVTLKDKIAASQARLATLTDPEERKAEMKIMADLQTRLAIEMEGLRKYG